MTTKSFAAVAMAAMLVFAGCSALPGSGPGASDGPSDGTSSDAVSGTGTVTFYVSDERNAIEDFESLNVTITKVGFHRADGDGNGTAEPTATPANASEADADDSEDESEGESEDEDGDGEWVTRDVEDRTLDLTELQGENATRLSTMNVPNGTYDKVFVYVSEVDGTLKNGEQVNVKLPSNRLHLNTRFTVGDGEEIDFVYDATVFKAGNSGKYILKPVVSESGTDVPIREVDADGEDETDIGARFVGQVERGESATVKVTRRGEPVQNATVTVGDREYTTGGDGTVMFDVPDDAEEIEVEVEYRDAEAELKRRFGGGDGDGGGNDRGDDGDDRGDGGDGGGNDRGDGGDARNALGASEQMAAV